MNEIQVTNINQIETEIILLKNQTAQNIIEIGKQQLGNNATLKQICNYVAPQFGLKPIDCMELILFVRRNDNE